MLLFLKMIKRLKTNYFKSLTILFEMKYIYGIYIINIVGKFKIAYFKYCLF